MRGFFLPVIISLSVLLLSAIASATDWYARPYTPAGYGTSDGSSYASAFNGIDSAYSINWNSIQPGDTLYICGFHDGGGYDYSTYSPRPMMWMPKAGIAGSPITIRGDCPGDPGTIFGSGMQFNDSWTLHDAANNIYNRTYTILPNNQQTLDQAFERHKSADKVSGIVKLNKPNNTNFGSWQPSSYHLDNSTGTPILYYKPASGSANDYTFYTGYLYPNIQANNYNIIKNLNLMSSNNPSFGSNIGIREQIHDVIVDNVSTRWAMGVAIGIGQPNSYVTVKNSKIREAESGIYAYGTVNHLVISNNEIYDLNQDGFYDAPEKRPGYRGDTHGIALQGGGDDMIIEHNYIHDIGGEGIVWYYDPNWASSMTNVVIRYNHVRGVMDLSAKTTRMNQRGIEFGGDHIPLDTVYNNSIYFNVLHDVGNPADDPGSGIGIRLKALASTVNGYSWSVYNNIVYNASHGLVWIHDNNVTKGPGFVFKNNIITNSRVRQLQIYTQGGATYNYDNITMSNNIYYPDGPAFFVYPNQTSTATLTSDFQGWKNTLQKDQTSMTNNPLFVSPVSDFHLQSASPAIDNGTDVGLTLDFEGNPIPLGAAPDIGAFEYASGQPPQPIPGDLNNDTIVDIIDLDIVATHFGQTNAHPLWNATADVVTNNEIEIYDVVFVASRFT